MKKIALTLLCLLSANVSFSQNIDCLTELNSNQISEIDLIPFSNTSKQLSLLHKFVNFGKTYYPEMGTWRVDYKIRQSDTPIFDFYGFTDKRKIENLICMIKKRKPFILPEKMIIIFREFDSGKVVLGIEITR